MGPSFSQASRMRRKRLEANFHGFPPRLRVKCSSKSNIYTATPRTITRLP